MTIHKEGYTLLIVSFFALTLLNIVLFSFLREYPLWHTIISILSILFFLLVLQFFRSPRVHTSINLRHIIAPADGKVVVIEEVIDTEYFNTPCRQISIFMSPFNVHVNRNPISGKVRYIKYHKGNYLVAWHPKSSTENERNTVVIENENRVEVLFRQIAGMMAKRIKCYLKLQEQVIQGEEMGFIKFGSRVDILFSLQAKVQVVLGQTTKAGKTPIAIFE